MLLLRTSNTLSVLLNEKIIPVLNAERSPRVSAATSKRRICKAATGAAAPPHTLLIPLMTATLACLPPLPPAPAL